MTKTLRLYQNCIPVKGWNRSIIIDFVSHKIFPIPNTMFYIFKESSVISKNNYYDFNSEIFDEYYNYLINNNLVYLQKKIKSNFRFSELNKDWDFPSKITNSIICYNSSIFKKLINQLDDLGCKSIQVRIKKSSTQIIKKILNSIKNTNIHNIEIISYRSMKSDYSEINDIIINNPRVYKFIQFSSNSNKIITNSWLSRPKFILIESKFKKNNCGFISCHYFNFNFVFYTEALQYNSCLNRKVVIDFNGEIKNCPAMNCSFGNILKDSLIETIEKPDFKKKWHINKDKIEVCKDCEFRYLCPDCRAFLKDPGNIYSQPAKCEYNPYIAKWKGEEGYVPVEECGRYIDGKFVLFAEKISELNKEIWG